MKKGGKGGIYNCRNNRLLLAALSQIEPTVTDMMARFGADRIGIVLGTSTSGVAIPNLRWIIGPKTAYCRISFITSSSKWARGPIFGGFSGRSGPAYTISTACSSSGKAFASARRLIRQGLCDAVIVGGADSFAA